MNRLVVFAIFAALASVSYASCRNACFDLYCPGTTDETICKFRARLSSSTAALEACLTACPTTDEARVEDQVRDRDPEASNNQCLPDLIIMETERREAEIRGDWREATDGDFYRGDNFLHNNFRGDRNTYVSFNARYLAGGDYNVYISYSVGAQRSTDVEVEVQDSSAVTSVSVDQTQAPDSQMPGRLLKWHFIGTYNFEGRSSEYVRILTEGASRTELVTADAVRFERVECEPTTEAPTTEAPTTEAAETTEAPTTEAPTTEAPTTEAAETTEADTTEEPGTLQPRSECIFDCKLQHAMCKSACGPRSISAIFCNINCKIELNSCKDSCNALPATAEPTGETTTTRFTTTTRAPSTTTRAPSTTTRVSTTDGNCPVFRECRCKPGSSSVEFVDDNGCRACSCVADGSATTASTAAPSTSRSTDAPTTTTAAPTTRSTSAAPSSSSGVCPTFRPCRCRDDAVEVISQDQDGCDFCTCVASGSSSAAPTTAAPTTAAPTTAAPTTAAPTTAAPTTAAPTTAAPTTQATTAAASCPAYRACRCKAPAVSEDFVTDAGCTSCRCVLN